MEPPPDGKLSTGKRRPRADDDGVRGRFRAEGVQRLGRGDAETAALAGSEPPEAGVTAELAAGFVDHGPILSGEALARKEIAVVAPGEEASLLAFGARKWRRQRRPREDEGRPKNQDAKGRPGSP